MGSHALALDIMRAKRRPAMRRRRRRRASCGRLGRELQVEKMSSLGFRREKCPYGGKLFGMSICK